jgi:hypothetical protein
MLEECDKKYGFVPAISCHHDVTVEFLGFEEAP